MGTPGRRVELDLSSCPRLEGVGTVFIGYISSGGARPPWVFEEFMRRVDFGDRPVIPFATSQGSLYGLSGRHLKEAARGGRWRRGVCFMGVPSDSEVRRFLASQGF